MEKSDWKYDLEKEPRSIPLDAHCMNCGEWRQCVRCVDIGWVCLVCFRRELIGENQ